MNRLYVGCVGVASLVLAVWTCSASAADVFIPASTRTSAALKDDDKSQISTFITQQLATMQGPQTDATLVPTARDRLVEASRDLGGQCSAVYLDEYSRQLNTAILTPLRGGKLSMRVRLNLAIAVCNVAKRVQNNQLGGVVVAFMQDPQDAVCLWGMKGASNVVSSDIQITGGSSAVLRAILPAAQAHQFSGPIVYEAYVALQPPTDPKDPGFNAMVSNGIPVLLNLFEQRVGLWANGLPDYPEAENKAGSALTTKAVWQQLGQADREKVMQLECTLLVLATHYFSNTSLSTETRTSAMAVILYCGEAIEAVGYSSGDQSLVVAPESLVRMLRSGGLGGVSVGAVRGMIGPILDTVKKAFPSVKPPALMDAPTTDATTQAGGQ